MKQSCLTLAALLASLAAASAEDLPLDPPAFQVAGVTMVPAKPVAAWLGLELTDARPEAVVGKVAGGRAGNFRLQAGEPRAIVLNQPVALPHAPLRGFGDLLVPLRFLADQVGGDLKWDPDKREALLIHGERQATIAVPAPVYPVVTGDGVMIGGLSTTTWKGAPELHKEVADGLTYRGYGLTGEPTTAVGKAPVLEAPGDYSFVGFTPELQDPTIAFAAPWNARPRPVQVTDTTQETYLKLTQLTLKANKVPNAKARLTQVLRVDLDGDGTEEVLLSATGREAYPTPIAEANAYSFVMLRQVAGKEVRNTLLTGEFYPTRKEFNAPNRYEVVGVLDLNGDGVLEILVSFAYYEGGGVIVLGLKDGRPVELFQGGAGA